MNGIVKTTLKVSEIKNNPNNPRLIKDDKFKKLVQSLKQLPIMLEKRPVIIDENNVIIGGNMRHKAAKEAGLKEVPVETFTRDDAERNNIEAKKLNPDYIDKSYEEQVKEMVIKDNVSGGEWDWDLLANEWDAEELDEWGLDTPDDWGDDKEVDEDEAPEVDESEPPKSKLGEIYQLGRHRVMCGDSTDADAVSELMDGVIPELMLTDPPYNQGLSGSEEGLIGKAMNRLTDTIAEMIDFKPAKFLDVTRQVFGKKMNAYIFCNKELVPEYLNWATGNGYSFNILFWKKPNGMPLADSHRPDVEYLIFIRKNATWNNSLDDVNYSKCLEYGRENDTPHPTMKPLGLLVNELKISSSKRGAVLDLFLGSGSTLIACEQTDRTCFGMELSEAYVDVIRKRYHKFVTGSEEGWESSTPAIEE